MRRVAWLRGIKLEALLALVVLGLAWVFATLGMDAVNDYVVYPLLPGSTVAYYRVRALLAMASADIQTAVVVSAFLAPTIVFARLFARSRLRAGLSDPLDRLRHWVVRHPRLTKLLLSPPALFAGLGFVECALTYAPYWAPAAIIPMAVYYGAAKLNLRWLTAPVVDNAPPSAAREDEIVFSAVAVTHRSVGIVIGFASFMLVGLFGLYAFASRRVAVEQELVYEMLAGYVSMIIGGTTLFGRASRIAVGIDGVLVKGTSSKRFYAYRDLDSASVRGTELLLDDRERVVLRLQFHGRDATRRDAILSRINERIATAAAKRAGVAEAFVEAATSQQIARAVSGAVDFRERPVSRDALWEVLEGPTVPIAAREAAARALAVSGDATDRGRLRVAAARCADPEMRRAMERLESEIEREREAELEGAPSSSIVSRAVSET